MRSNNIVKALTLALLLIPACAAAQGNSPDCNAHPALCAYQNTLDSLDAAIRTGNQDDIDNNVLGLLAPWQVPDSFVLGLKSPVDQVVFNNVVSLWERARVDKQVGAPAQVSGTTDLISRPSTPELLGLALQLGALTETVSGTTATFHANAEGAYRAILGEPVICLACNESAWKNLNFSASFDLTQQDTQQVPTSGPATPETPATPTVQLPQSSRQLSSFTARYDLWNPFDPRSQEFKAAWSKAYASHQSDLQKALMNLRQALVPILTPLVKDPEVNNLAKPAEAELRAAQSRAQLDAAFEKYFKQVADLARKDIPDLEQKVREATAALAVYSQVNYGILQDAQAANNKRQITAQYTFTRPQSQPETHEIKLILGLTPQSNSGALFTLNLAASLYGQVPTGAKYGRLRDYQLAAQFDRPLGSFATHPATFTLAGYVQYQPDPSVLIIGPGNLAPGTDITLPKDAQVLLGTKGTLAVAQAKITLNLKSGVNIPLAVSWANKTDLLNARDVRGNIGITYDFTSLSEVFGALTGP